MRPHITNSWVQRSERIIKEIKLQEQWWVEKAVSLDNEKIPKNIMSTISDTIPDIIIRYFFCLISEISISTSLSVKAVYKYRSTPNETTMRNKYRERAIPWCFWVMRNGWNSIGLKLHHSRLRIIEIDNSKIGRRWR